MAPLRTGYASTKSPQDSRCVSFGIVSASLRGSERILPMTKSLETITEAIRNAKHPFPQVADRPDKPHKNRYERRKIKQYIQLGDWGAEGR